jgi:hypothetical protein
LGLTKKCHTYGSNHNPLLWMVARIFSYKIVHVVGDFILSLLRLYLCFFRTFFYEFLHAWGQVGNLHFLFFQTNIFWCSIQRFYTNSHKSLILFYGSFLNFYTNSYKRIHTIVIQIVLRIRTRCGFCTNSYNFYTNYSMNSYKVVILKFYTNSYKRIHIIVIQIV